MKRGLILIILVASVIFSGCIEQSQPETRISENCKTKATQLIPETLELYKPSLGTGWYLVPDQKWKDDTKINLDEEDQKSATKIIYKRQIRSDDETILGTRTFSIKPAIKPVEGTEGTYTSGVDKYPTQMFEIIETSFIECNWID